MDVQHAKSLYVLKCVLCRSCLELDGTPCRPAVCQRPAAPSCAAACIGASCLQPGSSQGRTCRRARVACLPALHHVIATPVFQHRRRPLRRAPQNCTAAQLISKKKNPHTATGALLEQSSFSDELSVVRASNNSRTAPEYNAGLIGEGLPALKFSTNFRALQYQPHRPRVWRRPHRWGLGDPKLASIWFPHPMQLRMLHTLLAAEVASSSSE